MGQREVDLPQLFSDVSRTVSGIRSMLGSDSAADAAEAAAGGGGGGGGIFGGNVCFKACGMEDIQFAARHAGEMLITLRLCLLVTTIVTVLCMASLTAAALYLLCRYNPPRRLPRMPHILHDALFPTPKSSSSTNDS